MFHVSFRYIFGIPPLIFVLLPVASSDCEIEGKNGEEYQHVIMVSFQELWTVHCGLHFEDHGHSRRHEWAYVLHTKIGSNLDVLERIRENASNCLNNEPNFLKRHSCDDNKEATFLKTAARKLKQFVKMNIHEDFKHHLSVVSQGTLKLLNCTRKDKEKKQPSLGEVQPTKNLEEKKSLREQKKQDEMCFLNILLEKIKTCWNKILRGTKEH